MVPDSQNPVDWQTELEVKSWNCEGIDVEARLRQAIFALLLSQH